VAASVAGTPYAEVMEETRIQAGGHGFVDFAADDAGFAYEKIAPGFMNSPSGFHARISSPSAESSYR
jgi:hypothetical protein